jgi:hypothetical protein
VQRPDVGNVAGQPGNQEPCHGHAELASQAGQHVRISSERQAVENKIYGEELSEMICSSTRYSRGQKHEPGGRSRSRGRSINEGDDGAEALLQMCTLDSMQFEWEGTLEKRDVTNYLKVGYLASGFWAIVRSEPRSARLRALKRQAFS